MEKRISLITLGVRDIKVSRKFYETLGFEASPMSGDEIVFFQLLGMVLGLYPLKNLLEDTKLPDQTPVSGGITLGYNTRKKEEVDEILESAIAAGGKVIAPATETPWG
ncbi:MAG: VOC family protein, partial [Negativicutes bacterium]|nr:VOC family protein [Negativicutes bacterium]